MASTRSPSNGTSSDDALVHRLDVDARPGQLADRLDQLLLVAGQEAAVDQRRRRSPGMTLCL